MWKFEQKQRNDRLKVLELELEDLRLENARLQDAIRDVTLHVQTLEKLEISSKSSSSSVHGNDGGVSALTQGTVMGVAAAPSPSVKRNKRHLKR